MTSTPTIITVYTASVPGDRFHYELRPKEVSAGSLVDSFQQLLHAPLGRAKSLCQKHANSSDAEGTYDSFQKAARESVETIQQVLDGSCSRGKLRIKHVDGLPSDSHLQKTDDSSTQDQVRNRLRESWSALHGMKSGQMSTDEQKDARAEKFAEGYPSTVDESEFHSSTPGSASASAPPSTSPALPTDDSESFSGNFASNLRRRGL